MAIIDVVQYNGSESDFVYKFPVSDLRYGTQVVVGISQTVFFVKGGIICDQFESGTHTLHSNNIPILNKLVNLPFGGNSPFKAEVYYVNLATKLDLKWGTPVPIQLEDPQYKIIVPIRAFGQYGIQISNPKLFLESIVGNAGFFSADQISNYIKGIILSSITSLLVSNIRTSQMSVLEINAHLTKLSLSIKEQLVQELIGYGLTLSEFRIISINIPEGDVSLEKIKNAKSVKASIQITGQEVYKMDRSLDIMEKAAENPSGSLSTFLGAGMGIGMSAGLMGSAMHIGNQSDLGLPASSGAAIFYAVIEDQVRGPLGAEELCTMFQNGKIGLTSKVWIPGLKEWVLLKDCPPVLSVLGFVPPPINNEK